MLLSKPDVVKTCATIATSPNQQGTEGTSSEEIWRWTDGCVILRVFSLVGYGIFLPSKETHVCLFYKDFPSFVCELPYTTCLLSSSRCASRGQVCLLGCCQVAVTRSMRSPSDLER